MLAHSDVTFQVNRKIGRSLKWSNLMAFLSWSASTEFQKACVSMGVPVGDWMSQGTCLKVTNHHHVLILAQHWGWAWGRTIQQLSLAGAAPKMLKGWFAGDRVGCVHLIFQAIVRDISYYLHSLLANLACLDQLQHRRHPLPLRPQQCFCSHLAKSHQQQRWWLLCTTCLLLLSSGEPHMLVSPSLWDFCKLTPAGTLIGTAVSPVSPGQGSNLHSDFLLKKTVTCPFLFLCGSLHMDCGGLFSKGRHF